MHKSNIKINLHGDTPDTLIEGLLDSAEAINKAVEVMASQRPNGRNYANRQDLQRDREAWADKMLALLDAKAMCLEWAEDLSDKLSSD